MAAGLAADEGGEEGGWGAEADLGLDEDGEARDEFHDAVGGEEGGEGDGWAAEDEDLDIPADLEPAPSAAPEGGDDGYFVAPTRSVTGSVPSFLFVTFCNFFAGLGVFLPLYLEIIRLFDKRAISVYQKTGFTVNVDIQP